MMEGIRGKVGLVEDQDMGDGMQCSNHPYRNNPGGICAFCLQEKLGKLVSSSFPLPIRGSSSSSPSPSFRSDTGVVSAGYGNGGIVTGPSSSSVSLSISVGPASMSVKRNDDSCREYYARRARIPFLLAKKKKKMMMASADHRAADVVFKRSKSTTTLRRSGSAVLYDGEEFSPRKRGGFWSFLYLSSKSASHSGKKPEKTASWAPVVTGSSSSVLKQREKCMGGSSLSARKGSIVVVEDDDSPTSQTTASSFERKVSRSRSVGCGSRSFSGDFFERISTGFGDCTLRRVESQREGKPKHPSASVMKERVKCGGIFSGFMMTSSSSSSSSSSYWVSSSTEEMNGKPTGRPVVHSRSKSWGWAFASPMRAFSHKNGKRSDTTTIREANKKNTTPNLSAIPSLLAVRS
ncbi:hypothetical protein SLEP1_g40158 [Rubroshorea leprosula]|uniref:Uncharacterized protein n=1 Tax=Rubroshorea leprosula TaxID=152421 RepID=A0AAV5L2Y1_9ROSI|nr:hypothetical protein SLEP1_g40158 [Rubroshorea leprosula]